MNKKSYGSILKSSSLIGGSQLVTMVLGLVRTKFAAVLLGPSGVGLVGTYFAIQRFAIVLAGMGISQSGVRDISGARGSDDPTRIAETVAALRRMSLWLGLAGALIIALLAFPLSRLTFGDDTHALGIMALAVSVTLGLISAAQRAVLQGFRRIADMAKAGIYGTIIGSVVTVGWYFSMGVDGIIPAVLSMSVITLFFTWYYARSVEVPDLVIDFREILRHSKSLLCLGLAFMWNGLLIAAMAYAVRMIVLREFDLAAVGIYSAAFGISGMIVNFVLNAMGADYFPRLSEISEDHPRMVQLVNEQTEIGILMALPAILGLIAFAPLLVQVLYTAEFMEAGSLIQWFALGCFCRLFQWPLGFVMLAKKRGGLFALIQTGFTSMHLGLILFLISRVGLEGVSIAFATNYLVVYWVVYCVARSLIDFRWSPEALRLLISAILVVVTVFSLCHWLAGLWVNLVACLIVLIVGFVCLRGLSLRMSDHPKLLKIKARCPALVRSCLFPSNL
ncbi:O-antigen translocase [Akkermansiaceae bacterium]|nr:O-antigen translocase [Akkermansiaceae bacterium]